MCPSRGQNQNSRLISLGQRVCNEPFQFSLAELWLFFLERATVEHIKLPAKLLDYFLRSNKSNLNQIEVLLSRLPISARHA